MAKGFKWLLPGAVKKMTTTKKQKTQTKQNVRKEADNKTNEKKQYSSVCDIQPFIHSHVYAYQN